MYLTPFAFSASAFALSRSADFSSTETDQGSVVYALFHVPLGVGGFGVSTTGLSRALRFALAIDTASFAAADTPSLVRMRVAANPHVPSTRALTPHPIESVSTTFWMWSSRVNTKF